MTSRIRLFVIVLFLPFIAPGVLAQKTEFSNTRSETVLVETRYGDRIKIDLCFPLNDDGSEVLNPLPVVVQMSYTSDADWNTACDDSVNPASFTYGTLAQRGYVTGAVNTPGSGGSEAGPYNPMDPAWQDRTYDAIEWLGTQSWSNGNVGTIGGSGNGLNQWFTAKRKPPHLKTMIPIVAPADSWTSNMPGGMPSVQIAVLGCAIPGVITDTRWGLWVPGDEGQLEYFFEANQYNAPNRIEVFCPITSGWWVHPTRDAFWAENMDAHMESLEIPIWVWGNWDDLLLTSSVGSYERLNSKRMMTIGLATHFSPGPGFNDLEEATRWFDYWLKGIDNDIEEDIQSRPFRYLVNRSFQWKEAGEYPIPSTQYTNFYLYGENSGSALANGGLGTEPPTERNSDDYIYVPKSGVTTGFAHDFLSLQSAIGDPSQDDYQHIENLYDPSGPTDQRLALGATSVSYVSAALEEGIEITGPVSMTLYATTSASDTDFVIKLVDIFPDDESSGNPPPGYWNLISFGNIKGGFRSYKDNYVKITRIPVGEIVKYEIELRPTSYWIEAGHKIGVIVTSSDTPRLLPNENPAQISVIGAPLYPSHITLPIIPEPVEISDEELPPTTDESPEEPADTPISARSGGGSINGFIVLALGIFALLANWLKSKIRKRQLS